MRNKQSTLEIMDCSRMWALWGTVLCLHILSNNRAAEGAFIAPSSTIGKLASRGQVWVDPYCNTLDCYPGFNRTSCLAENVCYVNRTCNGRMHLPPVEYPLGTWNHSDSYSSCMLSMKNVTFPTLSSSSVQVLSLLVNGSSADPRSCYFQRLKPLDPVFTLVFWISAVCQDCSIIEVKQTDGRSFHLTIVNGTLLCLDTECHSFSSRVGNMIMMSLRIINKKMNIFVNEVELGFSNTDAISFQLKDVLIGSTNVPKTNNTFELFYIQYYPDALTNDELLQMWSGMQSSMFNEYPLCQCPANYIYLIDNDSNMCTDGNKTYPRFNATVLFYTARTILDNNQNKKWALPGGLNTTLTFAFDSTFQIERIDMTFSKEVPNTIQATFSVNRTVGELQNLICFNKVCSLILPNLTSTTSLNLYNKRIADEIYIDVIGGLGTINQSYIITNLTISARCGCHGNADSCDEINGTYVCNCRAESHTQGDDCKACMSSYYLSPDQLSCSDRCQCNSDGVVSTTNPCHQQSGQCLCKANVEGRLCDTCKPYTYSLSVANSLGCTQCSCGQQGSFSCSNITGVCKCKENTDPTCSQCKENFYGITDPKGCKPCNCSLLGTVNQSMSCNDTTGQCFCKLFVEGLQCNACKSGYYKLEAASVRGCTECKCDTVGSESAKCDPQTGQCLCRDGLITDQYCSPQIFSIDPVYGPDFGGTLVTVKGRLLGSEKSKTFVYIGDVAQTVISVVDSQLVFRTVNNNVTALSSHVIKVSWELTNRIIDTKTDFTFKPNPAIYPNTSSVIQTFLSGGSLVYIYGSNLQSVKYPRLEILNPQNVLAAGTCRHNPTNVVCALPNMTNVYRSPKDSLQLTIMLDGLTSRTMFNISVLPDPVFDDVGNIRFQYPFEDTITLTGKGFTAAGGNVEYSVYLGVVACANTSVTDTEIVCRPAVSPLSGETRQIIEIRVGNIKRTVGTMEYLKLHETTNFIIIISCISGGIFLILVGIAIIFIYRRYKRNHKSTSTFSSMENKSTARPVTEVAVPNDYAELTTKVDAQPKQNGASDLVRMETVIKEPKLGFVNSQADDTFFMEEFLPKVEAGLREEIKQCFIAGGHFAVGRNCHKKGKQAMLTDGSLQNTSSISGQKLTIKTLINPIKESTLPLWANLALAECLRLKRHKHIHVLSILGVGVDRERFHILYPSMSQNILKTIVADTSKQFSGRQLLGFAHQVAEGLCFLASKDITHKDIAARNCMMDENTVVKLNDASFSWDFFPDEYVYDDQRERYLPLRWMAPESLSDGYYDMRTDVWSLAILVWELMTRGCLPFQEVDNQSVKNYIIGGYVLGKPDTLSDPMYELLCQCWSLENEYRPSIGDVTRRLGEIVDTEDDIYENIVSYSSSAASPKHFPSGTVLK